MIKVTTRQESEICTQSAAEGQILRASLSSRTILKAAIRISILSTLLGIGSCQVLPDTYEKLSIKWSYNGGMMPVSETIYLSAEESYIEVYKWKVIRKNSFTVTEFEMQELYAVFLDAQFGRIGEKEEMVYDRGGTSIQMMIDGERFRKSDSGISFISSWWREEYDFVSQAIRELAEKKLATDRVSVIFQFDRNLLESDNEFQVRLNDKYVLDTTKEDKPAEMTFQLLPGANFIEISLFKWNESSHKHEYAGGSENQFIDIPNISPENMTVPVRLDGSHIVIKDAINLH